MSTGILTACLTALVLGSEGTPVAARQHAVVTIMWEKVLWEKEANYGEGEGEWGIHTPESEYLGSSRVVDNQGRIFICDPYRNRVLVFTPEGERLTIIDLEGHLVLPWQIFVDETDNVYVCALGWSIGWSDKPETIQVVLKPTASGWEIVPVDLESLELAPNAKLYESRSNHYLTPLAFDGLRWVRVEVDGKQKCQIVDALGKAVGFLPGIPVIRDQKGNFYGLGRHSEGKLLRIWNASGEVVTEIKDTSYRPLYGFVELLLYNGKVYAWCGDYRLLRFAEDGTLEEEVVADPPFPPISYPFASPRADYLYQQLGDTVIRWEYKPVLPEPTEPNEE